MFKVHWLLLFSCGKKLPWIGYPLALLVFCKCVCNPTKMEFCQPSVIVKDSQACRLCNAEVPTENLTRQKWLFGEHWLNCLSKIVCDRPSPPRSSMRSLLPSWKRFRHFFTVDRASASGPYTDSSSARIYLALSPLRVKNWMSALCSMMFSHVRTSVPILILHLLDQKWSKTEQFNMTRRIDNNMHKFIINFLQTQQDPEIRDRLRIYGALSRSRR
jgi:hypothetical protein